MSPRRPRPPRRDPGEKERRVPPGYGWQHSSKDWGGRGEARLRGLRRGKVSRIRRWTPSLGQPEGWNKVEWRRALWGHRARRSVGSEERDRGSAPQRSAAGLLALLKSGVRSAAFQSAVEKLWTGSFLLCLVLGSGGLLTR